VFETNWIDNKKVGYWQAKNSANDRQHWCWWL